MSLKSLWEDYGYPLLFAVGTALLTAWQTGALSLSPPPSADQLLGIASAAAAAWFLTTFNPRGGKEETWFVPPKSGEGDK